MASESMREKKLKVLVTVCDRNGGLDVRQVGGFFTAIGLLLTGELSGRPAYHFYRRRRFPFFGGWVRPRIWLSVTYKGMQMLRANGYRMDANGFMRAAKDGA